MKLSVCKKLTDSPFKSGKEITLGAWYSPDLEEELWRWYKEAEFNEITIFPCNEETETYHAAALAYCKKYGVNAHLYINNAPAAFGKDWKEIIKGYEDTVTGFDVCDEPLGDKRYSSLVRPDISDLKTGINYVLKNFPDKHFTVTLWPNYACAEQVAMGEGKGYEDYVKKYCEDVLAPLPKGVKRWLGTDFYPYYTNRFDGGLLKNLELLGFYAKEYDADLYLYVQVMDSKVLNWRYPNERELALQYFTALAYGVKNIQVFCYQQPQRLAGGEFGYTDGKAMITDGYTPRYDENGNLMPRVYERTQSYYDVQSLNRALKKLSEAYTLFDWQGVLTVRGNVRSDRDDFTSLAHTLTSFEGVKNVSAEENLLVGCFRDQNGNDGYMLTNYSDPTNLRDSIVEIDFGERKTAIVYKGVEAYAVELENGRYTTKLGGGEGVFVIPQ